MESHKNTARTVIETFRRINNTSPFNDYVSHAKQKGQKIIGWICSYIPEEIIHASGALPVRIMGKDKMVTGDSEAYLYSNTCSFVRTCFEMGMNGEYRFLDGLIAGTTCDHVRRFFEAWDRYVTTPNTFFLCVPHKMDDHCHQFFQQEVTRLTEQIRKVTRNKIDDQDLRGSIALYNRTRQLLKRIYDQNTAELPSLTGTEMHEVLNACPRIPREAYNQFLETLLDALDSRPPVVSPGSIRFLISGAHLDNTQCIKEIEALGGIVVADELCTGGNYIWDPTDSDLNPLEALSRRYLTHRPCARMRPAEQRLAHLLNLIDTHQVDGVIFIKMKFCDLYAFDTFMFKDTLEAKNVPFLELEREHHQRPSGQMRTRVQAFTELIEAKKWKRIF